MKKEEYIRRYGEEAYEDYKKRQAELTKQWREKNREKSRKYGLEYYYKHKQGKRLKGYNIKDIRLEGTLTKG